MGPSLFSDVEDVARAFDVILHKGEVGHIYNIGGTNECANIDVAKTLIKILGKEKEEDVIDIDMEDPEVDAAALKIQASFKGKKAQTEGAQLKKEKAESVKLTDL